VALTLDESFDDISVSQEARRLFQDSLAEDIAAALGLARRQILVFSLRRGSVIATIGLCPLLLMGISGPDAHCGDGVHDIL
jgi:hypothetical protein